MEHFKGTWSTSSLTVMDTDARFFTHWENYCFPNKKLRDGGLPFLATVDYMSGQDHLYHIKHLRLATVPRGFQPNAFITFFPGTKAALKSTLKQTAPKNAARCTHLIIVLQNVILLTHRSHQKPPGGFSVMWPLLTDPG